ncbi:chaperone GroES [Alteromonas phage JH01]|nr:chaperone GroES [Alteromonas phage JH01]
MTHRVKFKPEDLVITEGDMEVLREITPMSDNVIVRVVDNEATSSGGIVLSKGAVEKSTLGVVLAPNVMSFNRDGSRRNPVLKVGDMVRLQRGNLGTEMPEAPEGQKWLAVPEDCIYYYRRVNKG